MNKEEVVLASLDDIDAELCKKNFFYFLQCFWSEIIAEDPVYNWHIEYLCDQLQEYGERVIRREAKDADFIINIPPGTSKSTICTVMFPAWIWTIDASIRVMTASYSASLSTDHAVKSRDIIRCARYRLWFPDVNIKNDQDNKTHYKNTAGGERYATSVGGTVTGFHAHIIIVDDPINPKGASSEVLLETSPDVGLRCRHETPGHITRQIIYAYRNARYGDRIGTMIPRKTYLIKMDKFGYQSRIDPSINFYPIEIDHFDLLDRICLSARPQ